MSSYIDMSLEDIIQKKKRENKRSKNAPQSSKIKNQLPKVKSPIIDARNKIISKKRTQITDAREKLAEIAKQRDARLKIEQMRLKRLATQPKPRNIFPNRNKFIRTIHNNERVFVDPSRQVVSQPLSGSKIYMKQKLQAKKFIDNRPVQPKFSGNVSRPKPILRTVENDIEIIDDPMGDDYLPPKITSLNRKASLQLKIITHNNDSYENRTSTVYRSAIPIPEKEKSPPRPPSILKKRPMAALRTEKPVEKTEKPALEYRIIVSNLRNTVTGGDIEELFGDVGGMVESRLVRPGTAEVIYKTQEDAQRAVDLYHNRQLDGQPMNCLLVTPRSNTVPARSSSKPALYSTNSNVEPDISTFHKVLFSNL